MIIYTGYLNHSLDKMTKIKFKIGRKMIGGSDRTWLLYPTVVGVYSEGSQSSVINTGVFFYKNK